MTVMYQIILGLLLAASAIGFMASAYFLGRASAFREVQNMMRREDER